MHKLYQDDFDTVEESLDSGVRVNSPYNHSGWTPFMWVCKEHGDPESIQLFLNHGANANKCSKSGETPLHIMARRRSSFYCLDLLIHNGANVDAQDNEALYL